MKDEAVDPRSACNLMLDEADKDGIAVSNLALQKLLYFAHARFLIEQKRPLISGYFEAWAYGPVHPVAYNAFKQAKDRPICFRAHRSDPLTGEALPLVLAQGIEVQRVVRQVMLSYGRMTPGRLVEISHAPGAPWHSVVDSAKNSMALGLRIGNELIVEKFKFHKVSVGATPLRGEPGEDHPFT